MTSPPSPESLRLLRLLRNAPLVAEAVGRGDVRCRVGGCPVDAWVAAEMIARGLIAERETSDTQSEYTLTAAGRDLADRPEGRA